MTVSKQTQSRNRNEDRNHNSKKKPKVDSVSSPEHPLLRLHKFVGNAQVTRMLANRVQDETEVKPEVGAEGGQISDALAQRIQSQRGGGTPLDQTTLVKMEQTFGADLSNVRLHTDQEADILNRRLSAKAFTIGNDIFFRRDANPNNSELLSHELTHVLQQQVMGASGSLSVGPANDESEREAEKIGSMHTNQHVLPFTDNFDGTATQKDKIIQRDLWDELQIPLQSVDEPVSELTENEALNTGNMSSIANFGGQLTQAGMEYSNRGLAAATGLTPKGITSEFGPLKGLGGLTSALSVYTGAIDVMDEEKPWYDRAVGGASALSGGIGTLETLGVSSLAAGGEVGLTASAGTALSGGLGTGAAIGSTGAVLGAGVAGYGAGKIGDEGVDAVGDFFLGEKSYTDSAKEAFFDQDPSQSSRYLGEDGADHSISGGLAEAGVAADQAVSSLWTDENEPAYKQTIGWWLADHLPSWLQ